MVVIGITGSIGMGKTTVSKDEVQKYVFAFEKFTITKEKELRVEIWESEGDRNSILNVKIANSWVVLLLQILVA